MSDWSAAQYSKFKRERTIPAIDLANSLNCENVNSVLDIGCGIGNSTAVLAKKFPCAEITGVDNSEDMLETARKENPGIEFIKLDAENEIGNIKNRYDIVFSNACIQWIPNHRKLLKELFSLLHNGGTLAVQIPQQSKHPVHNIMKSLSESEKWNSKLHVERMYNNLSENEYYDVLSELTDNFRIWETTYFHSMPSYESIIEWYKGTGLRPYLEQLSSDDRKDYLCDLLQCLKDTYPVQKNGEIIFKFPRLFFIAQK
ncbi:MAG: methyltransferase domain-containing protein [Ruminococcus sp.]|nr:methyltransferase domain-containing protein [Ruminococcus sp.]MDY3894746.1 methyltransferase domain-containing protein [Candidatus Fimenecus sp.]